MNVAQRFRADVVWMDERALDPSRVYVLKHTTRTVTAELDRVLALNQIGSVTVTTARPVMIDCYVENRGTGSFIIVDPATNWARTVSNSPPWLLEQAPLTHLHVFPYSDRPGTEAAAMSNRCRGNSSCSWSSSRCSCWCPSSTR